MKKVENKLKIVINIGAVFLFIITAMQPFCSGEFILPEEGGGMVHCDPQMSENIRLPVPEANVGTIWYRNHLGGELIGCVGNGIAGNGKIAASVFNNPLGKLNITMKNNLIIYDYYGNYLWSDSQYLNVFAATSTPMVDKYDRVVACDNQKIILVNASDKDNIHVEWNSSIPPLEGLFGSPFSPTIVENKTIILPTKGPLLAYDVDTGELIANIKLGEKEIINPYWGVPLMNNTDFLKIFVNYTLNSVCPYRYNSSNNVVEWNSSIPFGIMPLDPWFFEGDILYLSDRANPNIVSAIDTSENLTLATNYIVNGQKLTGEGYFSTINSACVKGDMIYLVTEYGKSNTTNYNATIKSRLYAVKVDPDALNESNRLVVNWSFPYFGKSQASPTLINDTLYFDGYNNTLLAEDRDPHIYAVYTNGTEKWNISYPNMTWFSFAKDPRGGFWYEDSDPFRPWTDGNKLVHFYEENGSIKEELDMKALLNDTSSSYSKYQSVSPCSCMTTCGSTTNPIMLISANHPRLQKGKWVLAINLSNNNEVLWKVPIISRKNLNYAGGQYTILTESNQSRVIFGTYFGGVMAVGTRPDCWFDEEPNYYYWDSDDINEYYDTVNVSFSLNTSVLRERVSVNLVLHPKSEEHPFLSTLYRLRKSKTYNITPETVTGYINATLPNYFPKGEYIAQLYLCNSTGNVCLDTIDSLNMVVSGSDLIYRIREMTELDAIERLLPHLDEIRDNTQLQILDLIDRLQDIRPFRNLLIDILGFYCVSDDQSKNSSFMAPPNDPPNQPDQPDDLGKGVLFHKYGTKTTDPDVGAKIRYQWEWSGTKGFPTVRWFNSDEYHKERHLWLNEGQQTIRVRAKNYRNPNYYSDWSNYLNVSVSPFCYYNTQTSQTSQSNINNPYIQNSYDPATVVVSHETTFQGYSYGFSQTPNEQYLVQGVANLPAGPEITPTFNEVGERYVNFTADFDGFEVYCNRTINIVNISPCFSMYQWGAQPNQTINFTDTTISNMTIEEWLWDFGDGCTNTSQNTSHYYNATGIYNVSLNVTDSNDEVSTFWQIVEIESNPPDIIATPYFPVSGGTLGCNMTLCAEFFDDNESGIESASVNISYPNGTTNNFTMYENENNSYGYEYIFNDTMQVGWYYYTIWVTDFAKNTNSFAGCGFEILPAFGYSTIGNLSKNIMNNISGSNFTVFVNGTAESISAYIHTNLTTAPKTKCMIYRVNDSELIGSTEEKTVNTGDEPDWVIYNFTGAKPNLTTNSSYVIACWSNNTCNLYYDNATDNSYGRYNVTTYGSPPQEINWINESRLYSIYCTYSTIPEIISATASPDPFGLGISTTITAEVEHYCTLVENITVNITYPNSTYLNSSMEKVDDDTFQYTFDDAWTVGQYDYLIWVKDKLGGTGTSSGHSFNISTQATIHVCTIKDEYENNEIINLTDPPDGSPLIGYELLDAGDVLHVWNPDNSYYFDTDSGIQLTNHYDEYWSRNILMLGYYNNDQWNLIYRTDELSGFSKNVTTDNETFVNATLWKDLSYQGYDFRLAIRYHLELNDSDLTVIPYIKNLGESILYNLGFGWEINDIKIADTYENDWIRLYNGTNWTRYQLDQSLDNSYTDMDYNTTFVLEGVNESGFFRRSLYLKWNHTLDYCLRVKSRTGEYNAPVSLFIKIGTLGAGQEKQTQLSWLDSDNWLGVDRWNYHSCSGYTGADCPEGALDGAGVWVHLCNENHWLVLDLEKSYNIKKIRGRSNMGSDPTSVDIYISNDPNNWGTAVTTGISTWQDTTSWAEVDITDTVGRFVNISITSTESGIGPNYLEFGGIPTPMTIIDVYGESLSNSTFYFNSYDDNEDWATNPGYMVDGSTSNYASTSIEKDTERCIGNTCDGTNYGKISKVELRVHGYHSNIQRDIVLTPFFGGYNPGSEYSFPATTTAGWSNWFDITNDNSAPGTWTWDDITNLDCEVWAEQGMGAFTLYCSKVEIRVTYNPLPAISNPYPVDGSNGVLITPTLNITVSDFFGDSMNISWLSNSSGSWQVFGTNNSVSNGTFHQVFSNATENGKWWYWRVNVSDGDSYNESSVYKFYTGYQSKINNTGSTDFKGYLLMQVHFYNETSEEWEVADDTVNETTPRTLLWADPMGTENQNILALDTIFNGLVNTSNLSGYGNGTYRIYAALRDPNGNVLICDDETELEATYEFEITF